MSVRDIILTTIFILIPWKNSVKGSPLAMGHQKYKTRVEITRVLKVRGKKSGEIVADQDPAPAALIPVTLRTSASTRPSWFCHNSAIPVTDGTDKTASCFFEKKTGLGSVTILTLKAPVKEATTRPTRPRSPNASDLSLTKTTAFGVIFCPFPPSFIFPFCFFISALLLCGLDIMFS